MEVSSSVSVSACAAMHHLKVYCRESSVHGIPNLVDDSSHAAEKFFWLIALIVSFVCCGALIFEIALKVREDVSVTYTSDTAIDITEVSFKSKKLPLMSMLFLVDPFHRGDVLFRSLEPPRGLRLQRHRECSGKSRTLDREPHRVRVRFNLIALACD